MKSVYIASPYGFSEATIYFYKNIILPSLKNELGLIVFDPWDLDPKLKIRLNQLQTSEYQNINQWKDFNYLVALQNRISIQRCDFMIAILDGTDVDSGTASEIGYAVGIGKRVYGYRGDFRLISDNIGSKVNLQVESFLQKIYFDWNELIIDMKNYQLVEIKVKQVCRD